MIRKILTLCIIVILLQTSILTIAGTKLEETIKEKNISNLKKTKNNQGNGHAQFYLYINEEYKTSDINMFNQNYWNEKYNPYVAEGYRDIQITASGGYRVKGYWALNYFVINNGNTYIYNEEMREFEAYYLGPSDYKEVIIQDSKTKDLYLARGHCYFIAEIGAFWDIYKWDSGSSDWTKIGSDQLDLMRLEDHIYVTHPRNIISVKLYNLFDVLPNLHSLFGPSIHRLELQ